MDSLDLTWAFVRSAVAIGAGLALCQWVFKRGTERLLIWWAVVLASVLSFLPVQSHSVAMGTRFVPLEGRVFEAGKEYSQFAREEIIASSLVFTLLLTTVAIGLLLFGVRMFLTWRHLRMADQVADPNLLDEAMEIGTAVGLSEIPIVMSSHQTDSAYAAGLLNPAIVLPKKALEEIPEEERRAVICHEMFHIRRNDLWLVTFMDLWFCMFFWNPAAWYGRSLALHAMEEVNDERTISSGIVQKSTYLRALINGNHPMVAAPIARFHGQSSLRTRIESILRGEPKKLSAWSFIACIAILLIAYPAKVESMPVLQETGDHLGIEELTFSSSEDGLPLTLRMRRDGSRIRPIFKKSLRHGGGQVVHSPDGTKIAFIRGNMANYDIYVANFDGSGETLIAGRDETEVQPHFSPDGAKIVYSGKLKNRWQIFVYHIADGTTERVSDSDFKEYEARWHPNSQRIIFSSDRSGQQKIWSMNLDGSDLVQITYGDTYETGGTYSRDGRYVFYMSDREGGYDIFRFDLVSSVESRLTHALGNDGEAEVSPDNQWVYFTTGRNRKVQIARMRLDGSDESVFTHTDGTWPKFRPVSAPSQPAR